MIKVANTRHKIASLFTAAALVVGSLAISTPAHATIPDAYGDAEFIGPSFEYGYWAGCVDLNMGGANGVPASIDSFSEGPYAYIDGTQICIFQPGMIYTSHTYVYYTTTTSETGMVDFTLLWP